MLDELTEKLAAALASIEAAQDRSRTLIAEGVRKAKETGQAGLRELLDQHQSEVMLQVRAELKAQLEPIHDVLRVLVERSPTRSTA